MIFKNFFYFVAEAFRGLFKNGWMSLASIGVVAIALLIFGIFVLLNINIESWSDELRDQIEVVLFIEDGVGDSYLSELQNFLHTDVSIKEITFVSKEEALEDLEKMLGSEYMEGIEINPLRDSYVVSVWEPESVVALVNHLQGFMAVGEVIYHQEVVEKLTLFTRALRIAALTLMVLLAVTATFLISHNIRMTVMLRRKEIMIMKYVGATDSFIRMPFLIEGLLLGIIGTMIPLVAIFYGYAALVEIVEAELAFLNMVPFRQALEISIKFILPLGVGLGVIGSVFSIGKYLKV